MALIASLVVGANGATSLNGRSTGLSTDSDRKRFLARHRSAAAFIIGKQSASIESYAKTKVPIFIFSRSSTPLIFIHPLMQQVTVNKGDMAEIARRIDQRTDGDVVIEAGISLLKALIESGVVDLLELSISPISGDDHFVDIEDLLENFTCSETRAEDGTRLLHCRYKGDSTNS